MNSDDPHLHQIERRDSSCLRGFIEIKSTALYRRLMQGLSTFIGYAASYIFVWTLKVLKLVLERLPTKLWSTLAWGLTPIVWLALKRRRKQAIENIQTVLSLDLTKAKSLGKASFHSNILVLLESLVLGRLLNKKGVTIEVVFSPRAKCIVDDLQSGKIKTALALAGHSGVWEYVGAYLSQLIHPTPAVVASKLPKNPVMASFLRRIRSRNGLILIDKKKFARHILKQQNDNSSCLNIFLCDQHFNRSGAVRVPFLGKKACTVTVPATIIQKYNTPTLIGHCLRRKAGSYIVEIQTLDVDQFGEFSSDVQKAMITAKINEILSSYIHKAPEQWTWGHRRWRDCCSE